MIVELLLRPPSLMDISVSQSRSLAVSQSRSLAVANGGEPIPRATLDRLFQPFYRGEVRAGVQGLGLGLYIASQIAQAHGARLDVKSNVDKTTFIFRMPIA